jgi:hypothetical protein
MLFDPLELTIAGPGILFYSPAMLPPIRPRSNYLRSNYLTVEQVQAHIQMGTLIGFSTGSSGRFFLEFYSGYPLEAELEGHPFKLRLGLHCKGGVVCFRDLYDLAVWQPQCPDSQVRRLPDGLYHVTVTSTLPPSGLLGDDQRILIHFQKLEQFPTVANNWIPSLY